MATAKLGLNAASANLTIAEIAHIARALRRLNKIESAPVLSIEDRLEVRRAKAACWAVVGDAAEALVSLTDAIAGDPDIEDATDAEDEGLCPLTLSSAAGPGCDISDPDCGIDDLPHDWNELERDEGEYGPTCRYGVDQTRPIGPDNPEAH